MSMFGNLTTAGLEENQDRLGGFQPRDTGAYLLTIKAAYAGASESGAQNITIVGDLEGQEYRETVYITNKKGENFFQNKQDPTKKVALPGFTTINDICLVATEKPLSEQETEEKMLKIYDSEQKKEIPKNVPVLVELLGKIVEVGLLRELINKSERQADGSYKDIADTREQNVIDKVFHPETKVTIVEAMNGKTEGEFYPKWVEKNKGVTRDRRTIKDGAPAAGNGAPPKAGASSSAPAPRASLFGNKK